MQKSEKGSAGDFGSLRVWRKAPESLAITRSHCALDHIPRVYSQSGNQVCSGNLVSDDSTIRRFDDSALHKKEDSEVTLCAGIGPAWGFLCRLTRGYCRVSDAGGGIVISFDPYREKARFNACRSAYFGSNRDRLRGGASGACLA